MAQPVPSAPQQPPFNPYWQDPGALNAPYPPVPGSQAYRDDLPPYAAFASAQAQAVAAGAAPTRSETPQSAARANAAARPVFSWLAAAVACGTSLIILFALDIPNPNALVISFIAGAAFGFLGGRNSSSTPGTETIKTTTNTTYASSAPVIGAGVWWQDSPAIPYDPFAGSSNLYGIGSGVCTPLFVGSSSSFSSPPEGQSVRDLVNEQYSSPGPSNGPPLGAAVAHFNNQRLSRNCRLFGSGSCGGL